MNETSQEETSQAPIDIAAPESAPVGAAASPPSDSTPPATTEPAAVTPAIKATAATEANEPPLTRRALEEDALDAPIENVRVDLAADSVSEPTAETPAPANDPSPVTPQTVLAAVETVVESLVSESVTATPTVDTSAVSPAPEPVDVPPAPIADAGAPADAGEAPGQ